MRIILTFQKSVSRRGGSSRAAAFVFAKIVRTRSQTFVYFGQMKGTLIKSALLAASVSIVASSGIAQSTAIDHFKDGNAKVAKGDLDGAIADYSSAIQADPKYANALLMRGGIKQVKGDVEGASADYNKVIELNPKIPGAYYNRGVLFFEKQNWKSALSDFQRYCELTERDQDYARLQIWLTRARLGEKQTADKDLADYLGKRWNAPPGDWISKLAEFLLDKVPESELFAAVSSADEKKRREQFCEAWFYAGMKKLLKGDRPLVTTSANVWQPEKKRGPNTKWRNQNSRP
jgi:lipoprotein NlpI